MYVDEVLWFGATCYAGGAWFSFCVHQCPQRWAEQHPISLLHGLVEIGQLVDDAVVWDDEKMASAVVQNVHLLQGIEQRFLQVDTPLWQRALLLLVQCKLGFVWVVQRKRCLLLVWHVHVVVGVVVVGGVGHLVDVYTHTRMTTQWGK